jgi:hypothetical protein
LLAKFSVLKNLLFAVQLLVAICVYIEANKASSNNIHKHKIKGAIVGNFTDSFNAIIFHKVKMYIAVRPCKWIKRLVRQRANGTSAMLIPMQMFRMHADAARGV